MDEETPKLPESPGTFRRAFWAGLAPKIGVGGYVLAMLTSTFVDRNWQWMRELLMGIGITAFLLGALIGVVLGIWVLRGNPTLAARKMGMSGLVWGLVILVITFALGGCVLALKQSHHERPFLKDGFHMVELRTAEIRCFKQHPEQEVSLQIILEEKLSNFPDRFLQSWCSDRQASEPDFVNSPQSSDFILVPGFKNQNRTDAIAVFVDPATAFYKERGKVPVVFEDGKPGTLSIADLEAQLKRQTGMTVAETIRKQREMP